MSDIAITNISVNQNNSVNPTKQDKKKDGRTKVGAYLNIAPLEQTYNMPTPHPMVTIFPWNEEFWIPIINIEEPDKMWAAWAFMYLGRLGEFKTVEQPRTMGLFYKTYANFEERAKVSPDYLLTYQQWYDGWDYQKFPGEFVDTCIKLGKTPVITWQPSFNEKYNGILKKGFTFLDELNEDMADKNSKLYRYIVEYAEDAKKYGNIVDLDIRPLHEGNIDFGYQWTAFMNGGNSDNISYVLDDKTGFYIRKEGADGKADGPQKYVAAWRNLYHIFYDIVKCDTNKVKFLWCPQAQPQPEESWNSFDAIYPGDKFVQMIGFGIHQKDENKGFDRLIAGPEEFLSRHKGIPVCIPETSTVAEIFRVDFYSKIFKYASSHGYEFVGLFDENKREWGKDQKWRFDELVVNRVQEQNVIVDAMKRRRLKRRGITVKQQQPKTTEVMTDKAYQVFLKEVRENTSSKWVDIKGKPVVGTVSVSQFDGLDSGVKKENIWKSLIDAGYIDTNGLITKKFDGNYGNFVLNPTNTNVGLIKEKIFNVLQENLDIFGLYEKELGISMKPMSYNLAMDRLHREKGRKTREQQISSADFENKLKFFFNIFEYAFKLPNPKNKLYLAKIHAQDWLLDPKKYSSESVTHFQIALDLLDVNVFPENQYRFKEYNNRFYASSYLFKKDLYIKYYEIFGNLTKEEHVPFYPLDFAEQSSWDLLGFLSKPEIMTGKARAYEELGGIYMLKEKWAGSTSLAGNTEDVISNLIDMKCYGYLTREEINELAEVKYSSPWVAGAYRELALNSYDKARQLKDEVAKEFGSVFTKSENLGKRIEAYIALGDIYSMKESWDEIADIEARLGKLRCYGVLDQNETMKMMKEIRLFSEQLKGLSAEDGANVKMQLITRQMWTIALKCYEKAEDMIYQKNSESGVEERYLNVAVNIGAAIVKGKLAKTKEELDLAVDEIRKIAATEVMIDPGLRVKARYYLAELLMRYKWFMDDKNPDTKDLAIEKALEAFSIYSRLSTTEYSYEAAVKLDDASRIYKGLKGGEKFFK